LSAPVVNVHLDGVYFEVTICCKNTTHTVFTFVFMLFCYECTLMPSRYNLKYVD